MDFLSACKEAEALGISRQQFLKLWEQDTKLKQAESELRLHQLRSQAQRDQASFDAASINELVDTQLKKFTSDQRQVMEDLKKELKQQNQALIADISRLLEGFASLVGRVVKQELQTAMVGFEFSSHSGMENQLSHQTVMHDQKTTRTWSKEHDEKAASQELSSSEDLTTSKDLALKQTVGTVKHTIRPQQQLRACETASFYSQSSNRQKEKVIDAKCARSQPSNGLKEKVTDAENVSSQSTQKQKYFSDDMSEATNLSSSQASIPRDTSASSAVHFFPEDGPANMSIPDIVKVAHSGNVKKSPVYYLQDCPCKVQLSLWFDLNKKMHMSANLWGLSLHPVKSARIFTFSGAIKNQASQGYSSLFCSESSPCGLKHPSFQTVKLKLSLKTGTGDYNMNLTELEKRNYILTDRGAISVNWTVKSKEVQT